MAIVGTPGALELLAQILDPSSGKLQEDAALVVSFALPFSCSLIMRNEHIAESVLPAILPAAT